MKLRFLLYLAIPCLFLLSCEGGNEGEEGCTDPLAINYNATATVDDGTCTYEGCTDPEAFNYNPAATVDNGECIYEGCTDPAALNFDPEASIDDGSCEYPPTRGLVRKWNSMGILMPWWKSACSVGLRRTCSRPCSPAEPPLKRSSAMRIGVNCPRLDNASMKMRC